MDHNTTPEISGYPEGDMENVKGNLSIFRTFILFFKIMSVLFSLIGSIILWVTKFRSLDPISVHVGPITLNDILIIINAINIIYGFISENNIVFHMGQI